METIKCPKCRNLISDNQDICPFCFSRVQYEFSKIRIREEEKLKERKAQKQQQFIVAHKSEINKLREEYRKYSELHSKEEAKDNPYVPKGSDNGALAQIVLGVMLGIIIMITVNMVFGVITLLFGPMLIAVARDILIDNWQKQHLNNLEQYRSEMSKIKEQLKKYGVEG